MTQKRRADMICVGCFDISQIDEKDYQRLFLQASPERQSRAARYLRREDKIRCVVADALIRYAVEQTLQIADFTVAQDANGKPYIAGKEDFYFNLSHSGNWVVIAYGGAPVGIDVQEIRSGDATQRLAHRYFTPEEQAFIFDTGADDWENRFFQIWTAKESYLKYTGTGLRQPLDGFCMVPDGSHLGVRLHTTFLPGHCMTVCAQSECATITHHLQIDDIIRPTESPTAGRSDPLR